MKIKKSLLFVVMAIVFLGFGCSGSGTEVLNPSDVNDTEQLTEFESEPYKFSFSLSGSWDETEYSETNPVPGDIYNDPVGTANPIADLSQGDSEIFVYEDNLSEGESLTAYVAARIGAEDITDTTTRDNLEITVVDYDVPPAGSIFAMSIFTTNGDKVITTRLESNEDTLIARMTVVGQFIEIVDTISIPDEE